MSRMIGGYQLLTRIVRQAIGQQAFFNRTLIEILRASTCESMLC